MINQHFEENELSNTHGEVDAKQVESENDLIVTRDQLFSQSVTHSSARAHGKSVMVKDKDKMPLLEGSADEYMSKTLSRQSKRAQTTQSKKSNDSKQLAQSNKSSAGTKLNNLTKAWIPDFLPRQTLVARPTLNKSKKDGRPNYQPVIMPSESMASVEPGNQLKDTNDSWVDFGVMELEMAAQNKKDMSSKSRIKCNKRCLLGPQSKSNSAIITNILNFAMIGFNVAALTYGLKGTWTWLICINLVFGLLAQLCMFCVMCSDPGIISRDQDAKNLAYYQKQQEHLAETGMVQIDWRDSMISLNSIENEVMEEHTAKMSADQPELGRIGTGHISEEEDKNGDDRSLIYREARIY